MDLVLWEVMRRVSDLAGVGIQILWFKYQLLEKGAKRRVNRWIAAAVLFGGASAILKAASKRSGIPLRLVPRKDLDFTLMDSVTGLTNCLMPPGGRSFVLEQITNHWTPNNPNSNTFVALSVRTAFDLYLKVLNLPKGSEIIFSAVNIADMPKIAREHGLIPVPVDVDLDTMAPRIDLLQAAVTDKSRVVVLAHVFGARFDMTPYLEFCHSRSLLVIEDCAEAYSGPSGYHGHPESDCVAWSFGTIKTASALGGAVWDIQDKDLYLKMRAEEKKYPVRSHWFFFKRLLKYSFPNFVVLNPRGYGIAAVMCYILGKHHNDVITSMVRGFADGDLFEGIRKRPSTPLLRLLLRKFQTYNQSIVDTRVRQCARIAQTLEQKCRGVVVVPSKAVATLSNQSPLHPHTFWIFPVVTMKQPQSFINYMLHRGFDLTQGTSQLSVVPVPPEWSPTDGSCRDPRFDTHDPKDALNCVSNMVYIPSISNRALSESEMQALEDAIVKFHVVEKKSAM